MRSTHSDLHLVLEEFVHILRPDVDDLEVKAFAVRIADKLTYEQPESSVDLTNRPLDQTDRYADDDIVDGPYSEGLSQDEAEPTEEPSGHGLWWRE